MKIGITTLDEKQIKRLLHKVINHPKTYKINNVEKMQCFFNHNSNDYVVKINEYTNEMSILSKNNQPNFVIDLK